MVLPSISLARAIVEAIRDRCERVRYALERVDDIGIEMTASPIENDARRQFVRKGRLIDPFRDQRVIHVGDRHDASG